MYNQQSTYRLSVLLALLFVFFQTGESHAAEFLPLGTIPDIEALEIRRLSGDGSFAVLNGDSGGAYFYRRESGLESLRHLYGDFSSMALWDVSSDGSIVVGTGGKRISEVESFSEAVQVAVSSETVTTLPNSLRVAFASTVSDDGRVIAGYGGEYLPGVPRNESFVFWNDGNVTAIQAEVNGLPNISGDGRVVVMIADDNKPARWTEETGLQPLPLLAPGDRSGTEIDVSADGRWTVGRLLPSGGAAYLGRQAVRWDGLSDPEPLASINSDWGSSATHVSGDGSRIAGVLYPLDSMEDSVPALWTEETGFVPLHDLLENTYGLGDALAGWTLSRIRDITDNGRFLAGTGRNSLGLFESFIVDLGLDLIPGDYNGNGAVEQADLDLVLLHWGSTHVPDSWIQNRPSGPIDQNELDGVLLHWGNATAATFTSSAAVPEPHTMGLVTACLAILALACRHRGASGVAML